MALVPDLSARALEPELMDDPALDAREHAYALAGLRLVNRASRTAAQLWPLLRSLARTERRKGPFRVLDVACGSGDVVAALDARARRERMPVRFEGCDVSPRAVEIAGDLSEQAREIGPPGLAEKPRFFVVDVLQHAIPGEYDAVICSLFMHHLTEDDVVGVLARMKTAGRAVIVSDLERRLAGYAAAWLASRLFTTSRIVRTDALLSVRAAFTRGEFTELTHRAGMAGADVRPAWPFRFLMEWKKA